MKWSRRKEKSHDRIHEIFNLVNIKQNSAFIIHYTELQWIEGGKKTNAISSILTQNHVEQHEEGEVKEKESGKSPCQETQLSPTKRVEWKEKKIRRIQKKQKRAEALV